MRCRDLDGVWNPAVFFPLVGTRIQVVEVNPSSRTKGATMEPVGMSGAFGRLVGNRSVTLHGEWRRTVATVGGRVG